jgi:hypothetical protein
MLSLVCRERGALNTTIYEELISGSKEAREACVEISGFLMLNMLCSSMM